VVPVGTGSTKLRNIRYYPGDGHYRRAQGCGPLSLAVCCPHFTPTRTMPSNKYLSRAAYLLGVILVILPLVDLTMSVLPLRFSDDRWRFGVVGTMSSALLVPLLGLLIIMATAVLSDHRRVQRVVGGICIVLAIGLAVLDVLFILDFFQARAAVKPQFQHTVTVAASVAFIKHILTIIVLILLGRCGFAGPKPVVSRKVTPSSPPEPLIPRATGTTTI